MKNLNLYFIASLLGNLIRWIEMIYLASKIPSKIFKAAVTNAKRVYFVAVFVYNFAREDQPNNFS
jgi:hypothetical protein